MHRHLFPFLLPLLVACALHGRPLAAQSGSPTTPDSLSETTSRFGGLVTPGSVVDERSRVAQRLGRAGTDGYLLRSTSTLTPALADRGALDWAIVAPELDVAWNSAIPLTLNDGSLWAGRGWSQQAHLGVRLRAGAVSLTLAPTFTHVENADFTLRPGTRRDSTLFRAAWRVGRHSADLPLRFGTRSFSTFDPGQSSLAVTAGGVTAGVSTEDQWWGPGLRNAIVLGNNAPGVPHAFVRNRAPVVTRFGVLEARWLVGGLTESLYYDDDVSNDLRSFSALAATFRPAVEPRLTLGIARSVIATVDDAGSLPGHAFDVLTEWPRADSLRTGVETGANAEDPTPEQIISLFGRWIFPRDGLELHAEWARHDLPASVRDLLVAPNHTQGYTLGLQWTRPLGASGERTISLESELTFLEHSATELNRPAASFYTSPTVGQGYTHRGQSIGAAIGPGASSQWLAAHYRWGSGGVRLSLQRIRWDNDAYFTVHATTRQFNAHDVSLLFGARGEWRAPWADLTAELVRESRYDFLYQNVVRPITVVPGEPVPLRSEDPVDVQNLVLRFRVAPRP